MHPALWSVYDEMALSYESHVASHPYNADYDRPTVVALLGGVDGERVLDAGCGPGLYADELVRSGAEVAAFDASLPMVELARARVGACANVQQAVLGTPLPYADGSFDAVVCALTIHYVDDRVAAFWELSRVLRPEGRIVLSTHHPTREWLHSDRSYFDVYLHDDHWDRGETTYVVRYLRFPLSVLCDEISAAGLILDRLVESRPDPSMKTEAPETWSKLNHEPGFLALRLRKPAPRGAPLRPASAVSGRPGRENGSLREHQVARQLGRDDEGRLRSSDDDYCVPNQMRIRT